MPIDLTSQALTTLEAVKDELSIDYDDATQDNYLHRKINAASSALIRYLNRPVIYDAARVDFLAGHGTNRIRVKLAPLLTLTEIVLVDGDSETAVDLDDVTIEDDGRTGVLFRRTPWGLTAAVRHAGIAQDPDFSSLEHSIRVTYAGGWVTPKGAEDDPELVRSLPYEIEEACVISVASWVARKGMDRAITSEKTMSYSVTRELDKKTGLPVEALQLVASYRVLAAGG